MTNDLASAVNNFSKHLRAAGNFDENYIASPLGAWVLLAQAAGGNEDALTPSQRGDIEKWLGMDVDAAHEQVERLLNNIPEKVVLSTAVYTWADVSSVKSLQNWLSNLSPNTAQETPIPEKAKLDAWVKKQSLGILDEFPVDENTLEQATLILANVLATKISWQKPFESVESTVDFWQVEELLRSYDLHIQFAKDEDGAFYGYCSNQDITGVTVYTVIALDAATPEQQVITFAEKIAAGKVEHVADLNDLPASSDVHSIVTREGYRDMYQVTLPAWEAETSQDLVNLEVPLVDAADAILPGFPVSGFQVAKAEYNKLGFEAAALSAMMIGRGMAMQRTVREVELNFDRPFAAVAAYRPFKRADGERYNTWHNLPLFTAWVTTAMEPTDKKFD